MNRSMAKGGAVVRSTAYDEFTNFPVANNAPNCLLAMDTTMYVVFLGRRSRTWPMATSTAVTPLMSTLTDFRSTRTSSDTDQGNLIPGQAIGQYDVNETETTATHDYTLSEVEYETDL